MNESDFIAASLAEEIGIVGLMAIVLMYGFIVARGMKTALTCPDGFGKLLAGGLAFTFAVQVFSIIGGITRLLPLTGLTTPFMSQGGSSLIANWMIIGILMVILPPGTHASACHGHPAGVADSCPVDGGDCKMNGPLRKVSIFISLLMAALLLNITWISVGQSDALNADVRNRRVRDHEFTTNRGAILVATTRSPRRCRGRTSSRGSAPSRRVSCIPQ